MKKILLFLSLFVALSSVPTKSEAQFTKNLFSKAVEKAKQVGKAGVTQTEQNIKLKKATDEYNKAVTEIQTAISEDNLAYFLTEDRAEALKSLASSAETDCSEVVTQISDYLTKASDLQNTDYAASATSLIAKAKSESVDKASDYYLNAARTQYHNYCQTLDESKVETATSLYNEISSFEATLPAERKPSNELTTPETYLKAIAARKAYLAEQASKSASSVTRVTTTTKVSSSKSKTNSSSKKSDTKDPFAGKHASTRTSSGDLHDGKGTKFGSVDSNGNIRHGSSFVCKIDDQGGIYTSSGKLYGQVTKEGSTYVLYKYKDTQCTRYEKIASVESNGTVYKGNSRVGQIQGSVKDSSGKVLTGVLPSGVHVVHEAVVMFLYDIFR